MRQLSQPPAGLPIEPGAPWLAPLAGFSDLPFRLLCREQGAAVACTEMISAKGLVYGTRRKKSGHEGSGATEDLLATTPADAPLVVQLFGAEPEFVAGAAEILLARGLRWFDLNLGCPAPKVVKTGAGAALLRDPERALAVASALFRAVGPDRAGCKLRLGWDADAPVYLDLAKKLEAAGAAWLTLHPRHARQGFGGRIDAGALEKMARAVDIPVLASGDLFVPGDALRCLDSGARGVMFARGAMVNPAIFRRYQALLAAGGKRGDGTDGFSAEEAGAERPGPAGREGLLALILRHMELARALTPGKAGRRGHPPALLKMRAIVPRYVRDVPGARRLRPVLAACGSWEELDEILRNFFNEG